MTIEEKLRLLRADVDHFASAGPDTELATMPDWGSLAILLIIVHLEDRHRITVTGAQVRACRTVAELLALIP